MRVLVFISLLLASLGAAAQSTRNLILNNSFEYFNTLYTYTTQNAAINDSVLGQNPVSCWGGTTIYSFAMDLDDTSFLDIHLPAVDGGHKVLFNERKSLRYPIHGRFLSNIESRLAAPLTAGQQYRLTGYVNSISDSFDVTKDYTTGQWNGWVTGFWTYINKVGILLSDTFVYTGGSNAGLCAYAPSLTLSIAPMQNGLHHPWVRFDLIYTAHGGEQYITIGDFDCTLGNIQTYPGFDSIIAHSYVPWINKDSVGYETYLFMDDLTLIPVSDTLLPIYNTYMGDPGRMLAPSDTLVCNNAPLQLAVADSFLTFSWSTGASTRGITTTTPGTYAVTVDNGCAIYADSMHIVPDTTSRAVPALPDKTICADGLTVYTLPSTFAADQVRWSDGSTGLTAAFYAGSYSVTVSNQCFSASDAFVLRYTGADTVHLLSDTTGVYCPGVGEVLSTAGHYSSYAWSTGQTSDSITVSAPGTIALTVTDADGCTITDQAVYTQPTPPGPLLVPDTLRACAAAFPISVTAGSGYTHCTWNGQPGTTQYDVPMPQTLIVSATTQCGIVADTLVADTIHEDMALSYTIDSSCEAQQATIHLTITGTPAIHWSDGATASVHTVSLPDTLTVQAAYTCRSVALQIALGACAGVMPPASPVTHTLYVPNAFTPNGDGINDVFEMYGDIAAQKEATISVFNRWGELVYQSEGTGFAWDGSYKGSRQPGVYAYDLTVVYLDADVRHITGSVTLIR